MNIGASPSGKAAGFGPAISEVRVLPPQNIKDLSLDGSFLTLCAFLFLGCSTSVERVFQIVLLIRCTINLTSSRKSFVHI